MKVLVLIAFVAGVTCNFDGATALNCWHCSSVVSDFCKNPGKMATESQKYVSFVNCGTASHDKRFQPVCKTLKKMIFGQEIVNRSCTWEPQVKQPEDNCTRFTSAVFKDNVYCKTCDTDGCNNE